MEHTLFDDENTPSDPSATSDDRQKARSPTLVWMARVVCDRDVAAQVVDGRVPPTAAVGAWQRGRLVRLASEGGLSFRYRSVSGVLHVGVSFRTPAPGANETT